MEILVVPKGEIFYTSLLTDFDYDSFYRIINNNGFYKERDEVEEDETLLQLIPYIVVFKEDKPFIYQRLKGGKEARLHNKFSVGIGGHVDKTDEAKNNFHALSLNAEKELHEELIITSSIDTDQSKCSMAPTLLPHKGKLIYDGSNAVSRVHLGVLHFFDANAYNVAVRETEKIDGSFYTKEAINHMYEKNQDCFETWTTIVLKSTGYLNDN